MRHLSVAGAVLAWLLGCASAAAQTLPREPASSGRGRSSISGVVFDDQTRQPIRHASLILHASARNVLVEVSTDEAGRFTLTGLSAGRYVLYLSAPGYPDAQYGAARRGLPGRIIALGDDQQITDLEVPLSRGAVVAGVISKPDGQPAVDVAVHLLKWGYNVETGERTLIGAGASGGTDDRGMYRIYSVPPGTYFVATTGRPPPRIDGGMSFGGGREDLTRLLTHRDVEAVLATVPGPPTHPSGPPAGGSVEWLPPASNSRTFYPGTTRASEATALTVAAGDERTSVDFVMRIVPTASLRVALSLPAGITSMRSEVRLFGDTEVLQDSSMKTFQRNADGAFGITGVQPGDYVVTAQVFPAPTAGAGDSAGTGFLTATTRVVVTGREIPDLVLSPQPGVTVAGSVQVDGTPPAEGLRTLFLGLLPVISAGGVGMSPAAVVPDASGRFAIAGVPPGRYYVRVTSSAIDWSLKSALVDRREIADLPVEITAPISDLAVTVTTRPPELSGTIRTSAGDPSASHWTIVFSTDRRYWSPSSRRVVAIRPTSDGTFKVHQLPAGEYFIAARSDLEPGQWVDPDFLQQLLGAMPQRITLGDGERRVVHLVVRVP